MPVEEEHDGWIGQLPSHHADRCELDPDAFMGVDLIRRGMADAEVRAALVPFEVILPQLDERQRWLLTILDRDPHQVMPGDRRRSLSMS